MKTNSKHKSEVRTVLLGCTTKPWLKSAQELLVCYRLSLGWGIWTNLIFGKIILFKISGRQFGYDRALEIIQDEEYLEDADFDEIRHSTIY